MVDRLPNAASSRPLLLIGALIGLVVVGIAVFRGFGSGDAAIPQLWVSDSGDLHQVYGEEQPDATNMVLDDVDSIGFIGWPGGLSSEQGAFSFETVAPVDGRLLVNVRLENGDGVLVELFEDRRPGEVILRKDASMTVVVRDEKISIAADEECYRGKIDELATGRVYRGDECAVSAVGDFVGREEVGGASIFSVFDGEGQLLLTREDPNPIGGKFGPYFLTTDFDDRNSRVFDVGTGELLVGTSAERENDESDDEPVDTRLIASENGLGFAVQQGPDIYFFTEDPANSRVFTPVEGGDGKAQAVMRDEGMLLRYRDSDDKTTVYLWRYDAEEPDVVFSAYENVMNMDMLGDEVLLATSQLPDSDDADPRYRLVAIVGENERDIHEGEGFVYFRVSDDRIAITEEVPDGGEQRMMFVSGSGDKAFASRYYKGINWIGADGDLIYVLGVEDSSQIPLRADFGAGEVIELEEIDSLWSYYLKGSDLLVTDRFVGSTSTTYTYGPDEYYPTDEVRGYSVFPTHLDTTKTGS